MPGSPEKTRGVTIEVLDIVAKAAAAASVFAALSASAMIAPGVMGVAAAAAIFATVTELVVRERGQKAKDKNPKAGMELSSHR